MRLRRWPATQRPLPPTAPTWRRWVLAGVVPEWVASWLIGWRAGSAANHAAGDQSTIPVFSPVTNLQVSWLGAHYVRRQDYPAAIPYFEAAARVQPREVVQWTGGAVGRSGRQGQGRRQNAVWRLACSSRIASSREAELLVRLFPAPLPATWQRRASGH